MTTKKLLCAAVVLTTVLTGCSSAPVKTEKKDKTEEVSKKKSKDSKRETSKDSKKEEIAKNKKETAKNEEKTKEAAKIAEKDTKEAQKQQVAEVKKAVETASNNQQTNHKTKSTTYKHEDNKVENTVSKNESSSENKPSNDKKPTGSTGSSSSKNDKPCTPKYEYVTISAVTHVEKVLVRDAWTEPGITNWMCQGCEQLFSTEDAIEQHQQAAIMNGDYSHTGSSTITIKAPVYHPTEYKETIVVDAPERKEKQQVGCE